MGHYYDKTPEVESNTSQFSYTHHQTTLLLTTDAGVFSKGKIDFGSDLLVQTFLKAHPPGPKKKVVDVGCGYGPIGLMIAKVAPHDAVTLLDVNQRALALAEKNRIDNQIDNATIMESDGLSNVADQSMNYVVTNPPIRAGKQVVHRILEDAHTKLSNNGMLYVVIQKKQGMPSAKAKMEVIFGNVEVAAKSKGYYILRSTRVD